MGVDLAKSKRSRVAPSIVQAPELVRGFRLCIQNAQELMNAARVCHSKAPSKTLALAQLGQEELGKSFLILAALSRSTDHVDWPQFWKDWRNHNRKAAAAFFYEWLHPVQIVVPTADGRLLTGMPLRDSLAEEKEVGLYVDYEATTHQFVSPASAVSAAEAFSRLSTLLSLTYTAVAVHDVLVAQDPEFRFSTFAEVPARILASFVPQEEIPAILDEMAGRSPSHADMIAELRAAFAGNLAHLQEIQARKKVSGDG